MNKVWIPLFAFAVAFPAAADFKPACHDKDGKKKHGQVAPLPPAPPTPGQVEQARQLLAQTALTDRQLRRGFRDLMGRAGTQMLRQRVRDLRANHQRMTRAQRADFMRTTLQNWMNQLGGATGVSFDQYVDANNGTIPVVPPAGNVAAGAAPAPPAQGTVGVVPPANGMQ